jgi:gentisate 1,2-dioxygenase
LLGEVRTLSFDSLEELYAGLPGMHLCPLWTLEGALTPAPVTHMRPWLWRYGEIRESVLRAGELISAERAERRVLAMRNPGTSDHELPRTTDTLWAAIQLVLPGEVAPAHRHTPAALRYVIEGTGGYTMVDGRRLDMQAGDFLLTPSWSVHGHGHVGGGPMLWLDGLDLPLVHTLHLVFAEFGCATPSRPVDTASPSRRTLAPRWRDASPSRTLLWKLDDVEAAFADARDDDGDEFDDLVLEYRDPGTEGMLLPTLSAGVQLLRAGVRTRAHRHTSSSVHHVVRGSGCSTIDGERFEWEQGDTFAIPTWAEHSHQNPGGDDALIFSFSDEPAVRALGLLRELPS